MNVVFVAKRSDDRRSSTTNVSGDKVTGDVLRISTHILKDDVGVQRNMKKGGDPDDLKRFLKDISSILFVYFKNSNESEKKNMLDLLIKLKETGTKDTSTKEKIITKINDIMKEMTPPRKENKEEVNSFIEQIYRNLRFR